MIDDENFEAESYNLAQTSKTTPPTSTYIKHTSASAGISVNHMLRRNIPYPDTDKFIKLSF